jgi:acetylornithine deacetylase/succinyl-diaminopimelate desuccinylase-like protein
MTLRPALLPLALLAGLAAADVSRAAEPMSRDQVRALGREVFRELVEIDTTNEHGATTPAAEAMARRFLAAGFDPADVHVIGASDAHKNLVVRLRGAGKRKPVLVLAHLDVVEAKASDWSKEPFKFIEEEGYFYGRGTQDIKSGDANLVTTLLRMKHDGIVPRGDIVMALTAGEETGVDNGVDWLLKHHRELIDAELCFNQDGGGGEIHDGQRTVMSVQTAEKVFISFSLTAKNAGWHSSLPRPDNAIYQLAQGLTRLSKMSLPMRTSDTTRAYLAASAKLEQGEAAQWLEAASKPGASAQDLARVAGLSTLLNAQLHTTCVPTLLQGGHAENALPQLATATVNCRMLPDEDPAFVQRAIVEALADPGIEVKVSIEPKPSPGSPLDQRVMDAVARAIEPVYGKLPVVPYMDTGASDGLYLRGAGIPVYAFASYFLDVEDIRAHGRDERLLAEEFYRGLDLTYHVLREW